MLTQLFHYYLIKWWISSTTLAVDFLGWFGGKDVAFKYI